MKQAIKEPDHKKIAPKTINSRIQMFKSFCRASTILSAVLPHPDMFLKNHVVASAECFQGLSLAQDPGLGGC